MSLSLYGNGITVNFDLSGKERKQPWAEFWAKAGKEGNDEKKNIAGCGAASGDGAAPWRLQGRGREHVRAAGRGAGERGGQFAGGAGRSGK